MADLSTIQAAETIKIVGSDSSGVEQTPVQSTVDGRLTTSDASDGSTGAAVPTVAGLVGGSDGTNLRALKTDSRGNLIVSHNLDAQLDAFGRLRVSDSDIIESLHFANTNHPLLLNTSITGSSTNT